MDPYRAALVLSTAINLALLVRLVALGTRRQLPVLFCFICVQMLENAVALILGVHSQSYRRFWVVAAPVNPVFYVLMVREAHRRAFVEYPGILSLARWTTDGSAIAAVVALPLMLKVSPPKHVVSIIIVSYSLFWEECVAFALTIFILFMIFLLWRFPIRLRSNLASHIGILCFALLTDSVMLAIVPSEASFLAKVRDYGIALLWIVSFAAWGILLRKDSGLSVVSVRQNVSDEEVQRRLEQLEAFNKMLK